jgi:aminoglycoside phosphotransferase (APT) family kinase protein
MITAEPTSPEAATATVSTEDRLIKCAWRLIVAIRDLSVRFWILGGFRQLRRAHADRRIATGAYPVVPEILARVDAPAPEAGATRWQVEAMHHNPVGMTMLTAGIPRRPAHLLIKLADTAAASDSLDWECRALHALRDDERLGDWRDLLPEVLAHGRIESTTYIIEERLSGTTLRDRAADQRLLCTAADAIGRLHRATARDAIVGAELLERAVLEPTRMLTDALARRRGQRPNIVALERLADDLCASLDGRVSVLSWIHGDYWSGNILANGNGELSGIIDWEFARPDDIPSFDLATLILLARAESSGHHLGRVVRDLLSSSAAWTPAELALLGGAVDARAGLDLDALALLAWLRHIGRTIPRCRFRFLDEGLWIHSQVDTLLDFLARAPKR